MIKLRNRIRLGVRLSATIFLIYHHYLVGMNLGSGLVAGLVLSAIWVCRDKDSNE